MYDTDRVLLQFAAFRQQVRDLTSFDLADLSRGAGAEVEAVTLDYRDGRIKFEYKP